MVYAHRLRMDIDYENSVGFSVSVKDDDGERNYIIQADENGEIPELWKHYQEAIEKFVKVRLTQIGQEMAQ
jgi:hypothetical protein